MENILILSSVRVGGDYLAYSLAETYGLMPVIEPKSIQFMDNDDVALIPKSVTKLYVTNYSIEQLLKICKCSNNIIILARRNIKDQTISTLQMRNVTKSKFPTYMASEDGFSEEDKNKIINEINYSNMLQTKISETFGIPIDYYEDVYYGDGLIEKQYIFVPDISKKLRITTDIKKNKTLF